MWRDAWRQSRCLIPAVGWYEWRAAERTDQASGEIKAYKQPHFIFRPDRRLVCFGGLVSYRSLPDGTGSLSCAIVTRDAAPSVADVHDRMPAIIQEDAVVRWLDSAKADSADVAAMVDGAQSEFTHHPVTTKLNSAKTDEPEFANPL